MLHIPQRKSRANRPFPSCCEPHYKSEAKCKAFHVKISFVCIWMKFNFPNKNLVRSLTFIMRFKATRKWPITVYWANFSAVVCKSQVDLAFWWKTSTTMVDLSSSLCNSNVVHRAFSHYIYATPICIAASINMFKQIGKYKISYYFREMFSPCYTFNIVIKRGAH